MAVTRVHQDLESLSISLVAEFDATAEAVWRLWADPRLLERWWGPPTWPAAVVEHHLTPGGRVSYVMTGPDGEKSGGYWTVRAVSPPHTLEFEDGFADADGNPDASLPTTYERVDIAPREGGGTTLTVTSRLATRAAMEEIVGMGAIEGMTEAMGQMDALLAPST